jgi:hypothetical protein
MKLKAAAKRFDKLPCADAYSSAALFKGQFNLYDDSVRDGMTVERRVLSVDPSITIPARRAIRADGFNWLIGDCSPDYYNAEAIRHKYPVHLAEGLATLKTIANVLAGAAGTTAYTGTFFNKGSKEIEVSSGVFDVLTAYFAKGEPVAERTMISLGGRWLLVRDIYNVSSGFLAAVVDELPEPVVESATFATRTYNPISDAYTQSTTAVTVVRVRWQSTFEYLSKASETYERGDVQCMIPKTVTPKIEDKVTLSDGTWRVVSVLDESTHWSAHLRRA